MISRTARLGKYTANLVRLGPAGVMYNAMPRSVLRTEGDGMGMLYLCRTGGLDVRYGRRRIETRAGSIACLVPGGDREVAYGEDYSAYVVRVAPDELLDCMEAYGLHPGGDWSRLFASAPAHLPQVREMRRLVESTVSIMDSGIDLPEWWDEALVGRTMALTMAELLAAIAADRPGLAGPSWLVAARAEDAIITSHRTRLTVLDVAREVGDTIPAVRRSMQRYTGLTPGAFLAYVRLIAVEELLRTDACTEAEALRRAGFPGERAYLGAFARREEWRSKLGSAVRATLRDRVTTP